MGLMSSVKKLASKENLDRAKGVAGENADKISGAVGKATGAVDRRTGGKYRDKLDKVNASVERNLQKAKEDPRPPTDPTIDPDPRPGP